METCLFLVELFCRIEFLKDLLSWLLATVDVGSFLVQNEGL